MVLHFLHTFECSIQGSVLELEFGGIGRFRKWWWCGFSRHSPPPCKLSSVIINWNRISIFNFHICTCTVIYFSGEGWGSDAPKSSIWDCDQNEPFWACNKSSHWAMPCLWSCWCLPYMTIFSFLTTFVVVITEQYLNVVYDALWWMCFIGCFLSVYASISSFYMSSFYLIQLYLANIATSYCLLHFLGYHESWTGWTGRIKDNWKYRLNRE